MKKKPEDQQPETVKAVRDVLIANYYLVVHDLAHECETADRNRALTALALADWSVRELTAAWYDWWISA